MSKQVTQSAELVAVPTHGADTFVWKWRAKDGSRESKRSFKFFFDCLEDARRHGYEGRLEQTGSSKTSKAVPRPSSE